MIWFFQKKKLNGLISKFEIIVLFLKKCKHLDILLTPQFQEYKLSKAEAPITNRQLSNLIFFFSETLILKHNPFFHLSTAAAGFRPSSTVNLGVHCTKEVYLLHLFNYLYLSIRTKSPKEQIKKKFEDEKHFPSYRLKQEHILYKQKLAEGMAIPCPSDRSFYCTNVCIYFKG